MEGVEYFGKDEMRCLRDAGDERCLRDAGPGFPNLSPKLANLPSWSIPRRQKVAPHVPTHPGGLPFSFLERR